MHRGMRGGGSAGGGLKKNNLTFTKQNPKFLQQFRNQAQEKNMDCTTEKLLKEYHDLQNKDENEYDVENAVLVDENGQVEQNVVLNNNSKEKNPNKNNLINNQIDSNQKQVNEPIDLNQFKPKFISKSKNQENDKKEVIQEKQELKDLEQKAIQKKKVKKSNLTFEDDEN